MKQLCQACRLRTAVREIVPKAEREFCSYQLCADCAKRLEEFSLRPLEWFNLAAIHSPWNFHLHDDFYNDEGVANTEVEDSDHFPIPKVSEIRDNGERLVDMAITRRVYDHYHTPELAAAIGKLDREALLQCLQRRVTATRNPGIEGAAYDIATVNLKSFAADWIRQREPHITELTFNSWTGACAACLPADEGFARVAAQVARRPKGRVHEVLSAFNGFRGDRVLNWIENNYFEPPIDPSMPPFMYESQFESWGRHAAMAGMSWQRVLSWLDKGQPFSLIALDALNACWNHITPNLIQAKPRLLNPTLREEMVKVLKDYLRKDASKRATRAGQMAMDHIDDILNGKSLKVYS